MSQVINSINSCNNLKNCLSYLGKAYEDVNKAKAKIKSSLYENSEFQAASEYINKNISIKIMDQMDEIDYLGRRLVNLTNDYNEKLTDENGNKIPYQKLIWNGTGASIELEEAGKLSFKPATTITPKIEKAMVSQPISTPTIAIAPAPTSTQTSTSTKATATTRKVSKKYNYTTVSDDELNNIVNSIISNNMIDNYTENTTIKYHNNYYLWSDISDKLISKLNISNKIENIAIMNNSFVLKTKDGENYKIDNAKSYDDLINFIKTIIT